MSESLLYMPPMVWYPMFDTCMHICIFAGRTPCGSMAMIQLMMDMQAWEGPGGRAGSVMDRVGPTDGAAGARHTRL